MNKQIRTKLQFILVGILLVTFTITGCNNNGEDKAAPKDSAASTVPTPPPAVKDSMDTANEAPVLETKPK